MIILNSTKLWKNRRNTTSCGSMVLFVVIDSILHDRRVNLLVI